MADLKLLGVEILLASGFTWFTFCQALYGRPVYSVAGSQSGRQNQAAHKGRATSELQELGEDVRSIRPKLGRKNSFTSVWLAPSNKCVTRLGIAPGKIIVGLCEPDLRQIVHHFWPGKCFGEKDQVRMCLPSILRDTIPKNRNVFVCGLSTRNTHTPCSIQNSKMLFSSSTKGFPIG